MSHALAVTAALRAPARAHPATRVAGIAAFALLTALGAKTALPLPYTPVPITLQTLFVLLAGVYLGGRDGAASQLSYLALGAAGLPVFAGPGAGLPYLMGPTGGFLLAFPAAAWVAGSGVRPGAGAWQAAGVYAIALLAVLATGAAWLAQSLGVGLGRALALGVLPFLPGAVFKVAAATALAVRRPGGR